MKVRALTSFVVGRFGAKKGEILDVSDRDAAELTRVGVAEYVTAPAQSAQDAPEATAGNTAAPKATSSQKAATKRTGAKK